MTPEYRAQLVRDMGARDAWWALTPEDAVSPDWDIIDPHCHFWLERSLPDPSSDTRTLRTSAFLPSDLLRQLPFGHRVKSIVYVECGSGYYDQGPAHLRPVGETEFACRLAAEMQGLETAPNIAAIAAFADVGSAHLDEILDAHEKAGNGQVRAIRHSAARLEDPAARLLAGAAPEGLYRNPDFQRGLAKVGERGFVFEAFQFHFQLLELADIAAATPNTSIVVNHLGAPVGYGGEDRDLFEEWLHGIKMLARCPNVLMKLGGMASPVTEYDAPKRDRPPTSDEFIKERGHYFHAAIAEFGADRCMFESNFPVDSVALSYTVLWNAYKKMAADYSPTERDALLSGTAARVYGIA